MSDIREALDAFDEALEAWAAKLDMMPNIAERKRLDAARQARAALANDGWREKALAEAAALYECINPASDDERQRGDPGAGAMGAVLEYRDAIRALATGQKMTPIRSPQGSDADEWALLIAETSPEYAAIRIVDAIEQARAALPGLVEALEESTALMRGAASILDEWSLRGHAEPLLEHIKCNEAILSKLHEGSGT